MEQKTMGRDDQEACLFCSEPIPVLVRQDHLPRYCSLADFTEDKRCAVANSGRNS
jgi:hypothetical protein